MNKLSKEKRDRIILIAIGALVVAAALWYLVIADQNAGLEKLQEAIRETQDKIYKADLRIKKAASTKAQLAELRGQLSEAESRMIPVEQLNGKKWLFDTLVNFIAERKHSVRPTSLSNDPIIGKEFLFLPNFPYSAAAYDVDLQAYYHAFGKFLADFENHFPYIRIQRMQVWPIATPSAAPGPTTDIPEDLANSVEREQLKFSLRLVLLFKPAGAP